MHVLITSDTVGGVWTYTQELVTGLISAGHRVTLVSFGRLPLPHQTEWMKGLANLDFRPTEYALEWMEVAERDIEESRRYLELLVNEVQPEVLHLSQYCYGDVAVSVPKVVVAHSDVVSWWVALHDREPDDTPWIRRYRETVTSGLRGADFIVAPSQWMLDQVIKHYIRPAASAVVHNGRTLGLFDTAVPKQRYVLSVGRVWDAAKQVSLLLAEDVGLPVRIVGWEKEPGREAPSSDVKVPVNVQLLGPKSQSELRELYARAAIYAGTSRYEPFGLSPLEAALSHCALVLNDNPVFHELWEGAAIFFNRNDSQDLKRVLESIDRDLPLLEQYSNRAYERATVTFNSQEMVKQYHRIYQEIAAPVRVG